MSTEAFDSLWLQQIIRGGHWLFLSFKWQCLSVTKAVLKRITAVIPYFTENMNYDTAFKTAWAGFLWVNKFTYTQQNLKSKAFKDTELTQSDITFAENDEYAILHLKRSKTDINHQGVEIMLTAVNNSLCSVQTLRRLVMKDSQPPDAPLFSNKGGHFTRKSVIDTLHRWLKDCGIASAEYSGHSFRKGTAQHASVMVPGLIGLGRQSRAALGNHVQCYWLGAPLNIK